MYYNIIANCDHVCNSGLRLQKFVQSVNFA